VLKKEKERKQDDRFIESQRGALHKFFSVSGNANANVNEDQGDEPVMSDDHEPQHDHNLNAEVEVNEDNIVEENLHPSFDNENPNGDERKNSMYLILEHGRIMIILKGTC
jgi:hypothetical protein